MNSSGRITVLLLLLLVCLAAAAAEGNPPQTTNAKVIMASAASGLSKTVGEIERSNPGPLWVGYAVPVVAGGHHMCCFNDRNEAWNQASCCAGCRLEGREGTTFSTGSASAGGGGSCVPLEAAKDFFVLLRIESGHIGKVRSYSRDCALDLGGLTLHWLTEARPQESVDLLSSLLVKRQNSAGESEEHINNILAAIAFHWDVAADVELEKLVAPGENREMRKQAAFWLGTARGRRGFEVLRQLVRHDRSEDFRKQAMFALSVSPETEAQSEMIQAAHSDPSSEVRSQALFWLAQKAGRKVAGAISDAIENDPETTVKKRAVFALSEIPDHEGVPLLIHIAESHRNPVVRKEAMFWLGQSEDPRALSFIENILTH